MSRTAAPTTTPRRWKSGAFGFFARRSAPWKSIRRSESDLASVEREVSRTGIKMDSLGGAAEAGGAETDHAAQGGFGVGKPASATGSVKQHVGVGDGVEEDAMHEVKTPVRLLVGERGQRAPER